MYMFALPHVAAQVWVDARQAKCLTDQTPANVNMRTYLAMDPESLVMSIVWARLQLSGGKKPL